MSFIYFNANPKQKHVGDCVIRAISTAFGESWEKIYTDIVILGFDRKDILSSNSLWMSYLKQRGLRREIIPDTCSDCYTINDFMIDHPEGRFIVGTGTHVVAVIDGNLYDTWDSGDEVPIYFWSIRSENHALDE